MIAIDRIINLNRENIETQRTDHWEDRKTIGRTYSMGPVHLPGLPPLQPTTVSLRQLIAFLTECSRT